MSLKHVLKINRPNVHMEPDIRGQLTWPHKLQAVKYIYIYIYITACDVYSLYIYISIHISADRFRVNYNNVTLTAEHPAQFTWNYSIILYYSLIYWAHCA